MQNKKKGQATFSRRKQNKKRIRKGDRLLFQREKMGPEKMGPGPILMSLY